MNEQNNLTKKERWEMRKEEKIEEQKQRRRKRLLKRIALWLTVIAGIAAAIFIMFKLVDDYSPSQLTDNSVSESDWVKGNREARVVLIEYGDFQCAACANYFPTIERLIKEFGDEIAFVYRHFPLKQNHKNAELAAWVAEAAGKQNKFWEMYDILFANQAKWSNQKDAEANFIKYAESLNLNIEQFQNDLNSKEVKNKVENDFQSGLGSGINSTPTFFLNGQKIRNPRTYDEFRNIINQAIANNP